MSHSTNTVGEHLSQEDLIIKLHKAEKEREKGTESYGLQMFSFHTGGFPKRHKWFSMHSCMQILNCLYIAQQLFWEMHQPSSPPSIHILLGLQITAPVPTVFTMTGAFFKAPVPVIILACAHFGFNLPEVNAFKHLTNYYFQTIMEKIKYKPSEIQNLKMQNQKKVNNICYFKTTGKKKSPI